jgi:hypothetical protein
MIHEEVHLGTITIPPGYDELNPDSKLPHKAQSVLVVSVTSAVLSFLPIQFYWSVWSHMPPERTPLETNFFYLAGPALLFLFSYSLSFMWFGLTGRSDSGFKNPVPHLVSCAWAVLGIPAGSVLFNEALTTPRGFITKICYLIAGSALLAESVVLLRLLQTGKSMARTIPT